MMGDAIQQIGLSNMKKFVLIVVIRFLHLLIQLRW